MALIRGAGATLRWAVAERPAPGALDSGDAFVVVDRAQGPLVAVLDGLGHGPEAADAVRAGIDALRRHSHNTVAVLLERCGEAVQPTRGVVAAVCSFEHFSRLIWSAVGNVAGLIVDRDGLGPRRREVVQTGGILGLTIPRPHVQTLGVGAESLLVLATDGIHPDFREAVDPSCDPEGLASRILASYAVETDDALVFVGRYRGLAGGGKDGSREE